MKKGVKKGLSLFAFFIFGIFLFNILSFVSAQTGFSQVDFFTGGIQCEKNSTSSSWYNSSSLIREIVGSSGNCSKYSSLPTLPSCCPTDQTCNFATGICYTANIARCDQYPTQAACNADDRGVGNASVINPSTCGVSNNYLNGSGNTCVNVTNCGCIWSSGNCTAIKNYTISCLNNNNHPGSNTLGYCVLGVSSIQNNCNTTLRNMIVRSIATWVSGTIANPSGQAECRNVERPFACIYTAKLDFVSNLSIGIIVLALILIYAYLLKRRKLKKKSKK